MKGRTERMNLRCTYPWFGMNLPNHHFGYGTKKEEDECHKKHSLIESGWTNQQDMGKVKANIALSLSKTQARMMMRSKMQPTSY